MSDSRDNFRHRAIELMDSFLVEAKDQHGNERSLERLNQDRRLFIENLMEVFEAECRRREGETRIDERELALSMLDAGNQQQNRDFDLPRDFLDGWQDAIDTAAKQRDYRIAELKATIRGEGAENE